MPQGKALDPRLGLASFKRYELILGQCVRAYPTPTRLLPLPHQAPSTFIARLRDAILGYRLNKWETNQFTHEQFEAIDGHFVVSRDPRNGDILFRPRGAVGINTSAASADTHTAQVSSHTTALEWGPVDASSPLIPHFAALFDDGILEGALLVKQELPLPLVEGLTSSYPNLAIEYNNLTQQTIIM